MNVPRWTIGSLARTKGGNWPLLNAGKLVVITWYDPNKYDARGRSVPFLVERADGGSFEVTTTIGSTQLKYGAHAQVWISPENLEILHEPPKQDEARLCGSARERVA